MVALIQSKNHAANKGKTAGRYQFDTHPTGIGLIKVNQKVLGGFRKFKKILRVF